MLPSFFGGFGSTRVECPVCGKGVYGAPLTAGRCSACVRDNAVETTCCGYSSDTSPCRCAETCDECCRVGAEMHREGLCVECHESNERVARCERADRQREADEAWLQRRAEVA